MNDRQEPLVNGANLGSAVHCNTMQGPALQDNNIVKSTLRPTQTCACQHHDVARSTARVAVGRPLTAKATELPVFRAVLLTLRLAMACREFSSVPKNNAQRLTATKETASSAPSTMGKRFIVCGVVEHFRRLVCATLIRCTAFAKY
jgi:hypothetical protein